MQSISTPPIIASIVALTVGQIPFLKAAIFSPHGALRLLGEVTKMLGDMTIVRTFDHTLNRDSTNKHVLSPPEADPYAGLGCQPG